MTELKQPFLKRLTENKMVKDEEKTKAKKEAQINEIIRKAQNGVKQIEDAKAKAEEIVPKIDNAAQSVNSIKRRAEGEACKISELKEKTQKDAKEIEIMRSKAKSDLSTIKGVLEGLRSAVEGLSSSLNGIKNRFEEKDYRLGGVNKEIYSVGITVVLTLFYAILVSFIGYPIPTWTSLLGILPVILVSIIYIGLMWKFVKKPWVGLAILFFVLALSFAYILIWEGLEVHDKPIDLKETYEDTSAFQVPVKVLIFCNTSSNVFKEYERIVCSINISHPDQGGDCRLNLTKCPEITVLGWFCDHHPINNWSDDCIPRREYISQYGTVYLPWSLGSPGSKYLVFNMFCNSNRSGPVLSTILDNPDTSGRPQTTHISVRSKSEIEQQKITRALAMITSLFALFGIFPAVFYLRKLWENKD